MKDPSAALKESFLASTATDLFESLILAFYETKKWLLEFREILPRVE